MNTLIILLYYMYRCVPIYHRREYEQSFYCRYKYNINSKDLTASMTVLLLLHVANTFL